MAKGNQQSPLERLGFNKDDAKRLLVPVNPGEHRFASLT